MLVIIFGVGARILVTSFGTRRLCKKTQDVNDENDQNCRQHILVFANKFRPQHSSLTSM